MWEAFEHAAFEGLDNLTALIDVNRLGQRGETMYGWDLDAYVRRARAFGWHALAVDGHDVAAIDAAYSEAVSTQGRPTVVVALTMKGKGVASVENAEDLHGKPLPDPERAIAELGGIRDLGVEVTRPDPGRARFRFETSPLELPSWQVGDEVATRQAYGDALQALGHHRADVVALDGEVDNSTYAVRFAQAHPERYFEMYIAEQQMVAAAVGMQARGWHPFVTTFAAFLTRAHDFIRMAAISRANLRLVGSHAGTAIGADGPSQMGLEDLAAIRAVHGSTVLYPCDGNQTAKLVAEMADCAGVSYLRTTRGDTPVLYDPDTEFPIGGSQTLRSTPEDHVTVVAAGATVGEALGAADELAEAGIGVRVIDAYSVKPIDAHTLRRAARETGRLITVEDHWPEGGLGDAVLDVFADGHPGPRIVKLAARVMPGSAPTAEQLRNAGIDTGTIVDTARALAAS